MSLEGICLLIKGKVKLMKMKILLGKLKGRGELRLKCKQQDCSKPGSSPLASEDPS